MFVDFLILFGSAFWRPRCCLLLRAVCGSHFGPAAGNGFLDLAGCFGQYAWGRGKLGAWEVLLHYQARKWFPFKTNSLAASQKWFSHYGVVAALCLVADWRDALTFIAGVMRVPFGLFSP